MSEIEQQFFKAFGIEEICTHTIINPENCNHRRMTRCCNCNWLDYPNITAEKLLEMICIINKSKFVKAVYLDDCNYTELENTIIKKTITIMKNEFLNKKLKDEFKQQIQQLFKENNNGTQEITT